MDCCDKLRLSIEDSSSCEDSGSGEEGGVRKIGTSLRAAAMLLYRSSRVKKTLWASFSNLVSSTASAASRACSRRILTGAASESSDVA